jgi:hypothetical protein
MRVTKATSADAPDGVVVRSDDGAIAYKLRRTGMGVVVVRERRQAAAKARLTQTAIFREANGFMRWCEADSIRFDYPLVFSAVRREGSALFEGDDDESHARADHQGR